MAPSPAPGAPAPAPPNLALAVRRLARFLDRRAVAVVGASPIALGGAVDQVTALTFTSAAAEAARDGIVVLTGGVAWEAIEGARVVAAVDLGSQDVPATLAETAAAARAAGWQVAHASLLHTLGAGHEDRHEGSLLLACRPGDPLAEALDNGPLSLALDPEASAADAPERPARVLIASYEIAGPTGNGGIGTAYHSLAHALAAAGHHVTLLFTGWLEPEQAADEARWRAEFAASGIDFQLLGVPWDAPVRSPHHQVRRAYELHRWLLAAHTRRPFDVVHLPETLGHGAFALTAKRLGIAYHDLEFVIGTHSSTRWIAESNREPLEHLDALVTEHLERRSVELADVVISPTAYLLDYMRDRGWRLPERTFVQPLARPAAVRELSAAPAARPDGDGPPELVFFGRLETRKGLEAFCDAVDLLVADGDPPFRRVTFLGRPERVLGEPAHEYVAQRAAAWSLPWQIVGDLGHAEAVEYLRTRHCVAAIPSLVDNSPNTVIEVVALGIPFVASRSGGIGELIATGDLAASTFDGWGDARTLEPPTFSDEQGPFDARALADALRRKAAGDAAPAAPSVSDAACDRVYDRWHRRIAARRRRPRDTADAELTSAVWVLARDVDEAAPVVAELARGTRAPARVTAFVESAPAGARLDGAELVVAPGRDAGPARRRAVAALDADVAIVLRGSERPDPMLVERVLSAMAAGGSDVLSLVTRDPRHDRPTDTPEHLRRTTIPRDLCAFVPVAGPAIAAIPYPALSVGPYAIRRDALARLGGYAADLWGEALDRELLSRAALEGLRIDVLPDPVATALRDDRWVEARSRYWGLAPLDPPRGEEQIRLLRPFRRALADELAELPALLVGTLRTAAEHVERSRRHAAERDELHAAYERRIADYDAAVEQYERRLQEHRDLIALYERQKAELQAALAGRRPAPGPDSPGRVLAHRVAGKLRRATRPPVRAWPGRAVRFTRWRLELLRRKLR